jgi:hypothetical protein
MRGFPVLEGGAIAAAHRHAVAGVGAGRWVGALSPLPMVLHSLDTATRRLPYHAWVRQGAMRWPRS